jgi:hypothetical protein
MAQKVMHAALAVIKVQGLAIGKLKNIQCTENHRRIKVGGLGQLAADEAPPVEWSGAMNCGAFLIDLKKAVFPGSMQRIANSITDWENSVLLQEEGITIDILRKVKIADGINGIPVVGFEVFASIRGCFMNRESFDLTDGQISGRNVDFEYINPILFHF